MQFGPDDPEPRLRADVGDPSWRAAPSGPASAKPEVITTAPPTPLSAHSSMTAGTIRGRDDDDHQVDGLGQVRSPTGRPGMPWTSRPGDGPGRPARRRRGPGWRRPDRRCCATLLEAPTMAIERGADSRSMAGGPSLRRCVLVPWRSSAPPEVVVDRGLPLVSGPPGRCTGPGLTGAPAPVPSGSGDVDGGEPGNQRLPHAYHLGAELGTGARPACRRRRRGRWPRRRPAARPSRP